MIPRQATKALALLIMQTIFVSSHQWELNRLSLEEHPLATCIDGSPGAYYVREGADPSKVLVYHEGGGWCDFSVPEDPNNPCHGLAKNCVSRSKTRLGSTVNDTSDSLTLGDRAYFSTDPQVNPAFSDWTAVYIRYCDGGSFSGRRIVPTEDGLYSRGGFILEAVIKELRKEGAPLASATDVVVAGASSGGLAAILHANFWRDALPASINIAALSDAGFFPDYDKPGNPGCPQTYSEAIKSVFELSRARDGLDKECLATFEYDEQYKCMFAKNALPLVKMPILVIQSKFDSYQQGAILGYHACSGNVSPLEVRNYADALESEVLEAFDKQGGVQAGSGLFLDSCEEHSVLGICRHDDLPFWENTYAEGASGAISANLAVKVWADRVFEGIDGEEPVWIDYTLGFCGACGPVAYASTCM